MKSTVGEKGQVTIPKPLRDSLALVPGTQLDFTEDAGTLVARRIANADPFNALLGLLPAIDVDVAIAGMRGPQWSKNADERDDKRGR